MSWILSRRNKKESIYSDGHGAYTVITHSRGICNEKITPPLAIKKDREGFNENMPPIAINIPLITVRPIATEKLPLGCNRHIEAVNEHIESDCKQR